MEYDFELWFDADYVDFGKVEFDEWGMAFCWVDVPDIENYGVEYNYCKQEYDDGLEDCSAIYIFGHDADENCPTFYDEYEHYEIDFSNPLWKEKLEQAMYDFAVRWYAENGKAGFNENLAYRGYKTI